MENRKLKVALIKQVVLPDLYICPLISGIEEILFSSMMRVGPIGLFHEFDTDFFIVDVEPDKECQVWREINKTPINGPVDLLLELKIKTINKLPGQEFKVPGSNLPNGSFITALSEILWKKYDIIISLNISVPSEIVRKYTEILWCYMLIEPNIFMDRVYFDYDVAFNHHITGLTYYYPGIMDFPYTFLHPGLLTQIFEKQLNRRSLRNKIYIDISCSKSKSEEKLVNDIPPGLLPLNKTGYQLIVHNQNIRLNLINLFDSKYSVKIGGSYIRGNSVIESVSAGSLFLGDPDLITMNILIPEQCRVKTVEEAIELIHELEIDNDKYLELWWMQRTMTQFYVIDQPVASLKNALAYKRKYGPVRYNFKRRIIKSVKKLLG